MEYDFTGLVDEEPKQSSVKYDFTGLMDESSKENKSVKKRQEKGELKPLWNIKTPEEIIAEGGGVARATVIPTLQQAAVPFWKAGNALLGGLPSVQAAQQGRKVPESEYWGNDIIEGVASVLGLVGGGAGKLGSATAGKIAGKGILKGAARGAVGTGVTMGAYTPSGDNALDSFKNWKARGFRAGSGAVLGGITGGIGGAIDKYFKPASEANQLKLGRETRGQFGKLKERLQQKFGRRMVDISIKNKGKKADLSGAINKFESEIGGSKKLKSLYNASPKLQKLLNKKKDLTLSETQDLVNQLKSTISENKLAGFKVRPSDREVLSFIDKVQGVKHNTWSEMKAVDGMYGRVNETMGIVENYMKKGKTVNGFKTMFNNVEQKRALKSILPKETFKQIEDIVRSNKLTHDSLGMINTLIKYGVIYHLANKTIRGVTDKNEGAEVFHGGTNN